MLLSLAEPPPVAFSLFNEKGYSIELHSLVALSILSGSALPRSSAVSDISTNTIIIALKLHPAFRRYGCSRRRALLTRTSKYSLLFGYLFVI